MKKKKSNKGFSPSGSGGIFGGTPKPQAPTEAKVSGYSNSNLQLLAGISEGTIGGLVNGAQSIYINDTPVTNADGTINFPGLTFDTRNGNNTQAYMPGYADSVNAETSLGTEVKYNLPVTRQIINKNCDAIIVRLGFVLQEYPTAGGVIGSNVNFIIQIKEGSGAFITRLNTTIAGRYSSLTEFEYHFPVSNLGGTVSTFTVQVLRGTPTETDLNRVQKQVIFQSYTECVETKLSYPNTALIGIKLDASQFTSEPKLTFDISGVQIAIPTNSVITPDGGLNYSGIWDGTFYTPNASCADPTWVLWDLLTNKRYGLGKQIQTQNLDRWSFLTISNYCNQYVPDGANGYERRFLTNFVLEGKEDAFKVIETLRSVFRGFSYYINGALFFASDMPGTPVMQFTQADIEEGMFSYSRTSLKARHTVAVITWIDPNDNYKRAIETVEDADSIAIYGVRTIEISAFGATTRGQARRAGLAILMTEKLENETVSFKCRAFGINCRPGMIISVADSKRADVRYGGLIAGVSGNQITLDSSVQLYVGQTYTLTCMLSDGTIVENSITNTPGFYNTINLLTAYTSSPLVEGNWIISSSVVKPQLFRVLNRSAVSGSEETMYEITALHYDGSKYGAIDFNYPLETRSIRSTAPIVVTPPSNVLSSFQTYGTSYILTATWQGAYLNGKRDPFVVSYIVSYRRELNGIWQGAISTVNLSVEFPGLVNIGIYFIRVASVDLSGNTSVFVESTGLNLGTINTVTTFNVASHSPMVDMI